MTDLRQIGLKTC